MKLWLLGGGYMLVVDLLVALTLVDNI